MKQFTYSRPSENIIGYELSQLAKQETNDCAVISLSSAFEITYEVAHEFARVRFGRRNRQGTRGFIEIMDRLSLSKFTINSKNFSAVTTIVPENKPASQLKKMTVNQFIMKNPKGTFIVVVNGHAFTIKNGVVVGNYEDSVKIKRRVIRAYKVFPVK